jgi:hypothetical protein
MKKHHTLIAAVIAITSFSSCSSSSSFEGDVKKMARYRCEMQQLMGKEDEASQKKLKDLQDEMEAYAEKMEKKYKDIENDQAMEDKGEKIMAEEMAKCK